MPKIIFFLAVIILLSGCASKPDILSVNLAEHKSLALHIHPFLEIEINGENYPIPVNTGISAAGMRVIHTHDSTGKLHIESPYPHQFYLPDFFKIWGKPFNQSCIFEYCANASHALSVFVNGIEAAEANIPLKDGDRIRVVYGKK